MVVETDMQALSTEPVFESPRDRARFRRMPGFSAVDLMDASFHDHHFAPHTHDGLMLGIMRSGVMRFMREGRTHTVEPGGITVINPGDVHTGGRFGEDRLVYTGIYAPQSFLEKAGLGSDAWFVSGVVTDPECWQLLLRASAPGVDPLAGQEDLLEGLFRLGRHASRGPGREERACSAAASRALGHLEAHYGERVTIDDLARIAGVTPRHMIRSFRKATGLPPHAWLRQLRIRKARHLLETGLAPAEAAFATGFADQPHFSKAFKQLTGTTPARYRLDMAA
jgi:AraC-like DNA-binding protein